MDNPESEENYYNNNGSDWWFHLKDRFLHQVILKSYTEREAATNWSKQQTGSAVTLDIDIYCFADAETALLFALRFS